VAGEGFERGFPDGIAGEVFLVVPAEQTLKRAAAGVDGNGDAVVEETETDALRGEGFPDGVSNTSTEATPPEQRVVFQVIDSGVGISRENLSKLFTHGFTTRPKGHGYGLHSSANAAAEMGGTLTGVSEGPGKGAVFTLTVPIKTGVAIATLAASAQPGAHR
jgi:signal transduction histidine kinase